MEGSINLSAIAMVVGCLALLVAIVALHQARMRIESRPVREPYPMPIRENRKTLQLLVNQLDQSARRALEGAAALAKAEKHYFVELDHWLVKIFQAPGPELDRILEENKALVETIATELSQALSSFPTGNTSIPQLSSGVIDLLVASCVVEKNQFVRPSDLLLALITDPQLSFRAKETVPSLAKLPVQRLRPLAKNPEKFEVDQNMERDLRNG